MNIIQQFLLAMLSTMVYSELTGCPASVPTVSYVHRCPRNVSEWVKASNRKRCSLAKQNCTTETKFQYHCLINADINGMVEVCIPIRRIVGSFCPFYDSKKARIENHYHLSCREHTFKCPEHYQSNEAYKFQGCYMAVYGQEPVNKSKTKEDVDDENHIFRKIGDKIVDLQKDTIWTVVVIIFAIVFLSIFGVISIILKCINTETKKSCWKSCNRCYKCCYKCCDTVDEDCVQKNSVEMEEKTKENTDKDDKNDTNERLLNENETGSSDIS